MEITSHFGPQNRIQIRFLTQVHPSHPPDIPFSLHSVGPPPYILNRNLLGTAWWSHSTEHHAGHERQLRPLHATPPAFHRTPPPMTATP